MAWFDLTDFAACDQPLLPNKPRGVALVDDRRMLNCEGLGQMRREQNARFLISKTPTPNKRTRGRSPARRDP